jgi:membrane-bound ClpP family serine protease
VSSRWSYPILVALALLSMGAGTDETSSPAAEVIELAGILDDSALRYLADAIEESAALGRELAIVQINSSAVVADMDELLQTADLIADPPLPLVVWLGPAPARVGGGAAQLFSLAPLVAAAPGSEIENWSPAVVGSKTDLVDPPAVVGNSLLVEGPVDGLIDLVVPSIRQLLQEVDGVEVVVRGESRVLQTLEPTEGGLTNIPVSFRQPGLWSRFLRLAITPEAAFFFLVAGLTMVAFEFYALGPGVAAGVAAVSLLLAGHGISILPIRGWGLGLTVTGLALLVGGHQQGGVFGLTVLGTAALVAGGLGFTGGAPQVQISWPGVVASILAVLFFFLLAMPTVGRARFSTPTMGRDYLIGRRGNARVDLTPDGVVDVDGAQWPATTHREAAIHAGEPVTVTGVVGWQLEVEPVREN